MGVRGNGNVKSHSRTSIIGRQFFGLIYKSHSSQHFSDKGNDTAK